MKKKSSSLTSKEVFDMKDKLIANDNEAVNTLIEKNAGLLHDCVKKFMTSLNNDSFDDYMQEATCALLKAGQKYDYKKNKSFFNFAKIVITNALIDYKRQEDRWRENETTMRNYDLGKLIDSIAKKDPKPTLLDEIISEEKFKEIASVIKTILSEQEYEIMLLFYHQNLTYKDIATKLSIDTKAVDNILQAAKRKLKASKKLEELLLNSNWLRKK